MQKRGRPAARIPSEQITVRLPRVMIEQFRRGKGLSSEIQERLAKSLFDDVADPNVRDLAGQIEQLAKDVHHALGVRWYEDEKAFWTFMEVLNLLLADLPAPTAATSEIDAEPKVAAQLIYNRYKAVIRDFESGAAPRMRPTVRYLLEGDQPRKRKKP